MRPADGPQRLETEATRLDKDGLAAFTDGVAAPLWLVPDRRCAAEAERRSRRGPLIGLFRDHFVPATPASSGLAQ